MPTGSDAARRHRFPLAGPAITRQCRHPCGNQSPRPRRRQRASGPGLVFSALIPDMDYFNNRSGCVRPLYRNAAATAPNVAPGLLPLLNRRLGIPVIPEDLLAYIAAVVSHPANPTASARTAGPRLGPPSPAIRCSGGAQSPLDAESCGCTPTTSGTPARRKTGLAARPRLQRLGRMTARNLLAAAVS
ncbi:type ISP restriction/modification enzyme [Streptomyces sp. 7N604]|uniref:type ISP restriction/modification enzyme n=1 Tax=Streptomyces sp. 7N604 TaxID=3457415 RepID=UPI003FCF692A